MCLQFARHPHGGAAQREAAAEFSEQVNVGTRHAECAMSPRIVTFRFFERAFAVANGQRIEQALRRMLVRAVARIDHRNFQVARDEIGRAGRGVAHHETIRLHRVQVVRRCRAAFRPFSGWSFRLQIHGIRAQPRSRRAETEARARGILEKCESHGFAAQRREFLQRMALNFLERFGLVEKKCDFVRAERFDGEQITKTIGHIYSQYELRRASERRGVSAPPECHFTRRIVRTQKFRQAVQL